MQDRKSMTVRDIKALWDSFENKDMSFPDFLKEFRACTSPAQMQSDLASIMSQKQLGRSTRTKIDAAVARRERIVLS